LFAADMNSGTTTNKNVCDAFAWAGHDNVDYKTFNFNLPPNAAIQGIEVRIDAKIDNASSDSRICARINSAVIKATPFLQTTENTYILGGPTDLWGVPAFSTDFSDGTFVLTLTNVSKSQQRDLFLDYVAVKVH
jgi:hypothetical protein